VCGQGGAAAKTGKIMAGDHLVSVEGRAVTGMEIDKILDIVASAPMVGQAPPRDALDLVA
jgi:C-terminal processing protease CtpA/Prc